MRRLLVTIAAVTLYSGLAGATTMLGRTTDQLFHESDIVAVARVVRVTAVRAGAHILTRVTLVLSETMKGASAGATIDVVIPGGIVGNLGQQVEGEPDVNEGDQCVVFLSPAAPHWYRFTGLEQGKLDIEADPAHPGASLLRHSTTARLMVRGPDGRLTEAPAPPETEPLEPFLAHLRQLAKGTP